MPASRLSTARREEDRVGRSPYQSEKRRKELARLKKQEEKRQRRFNKKHDQEKTEDQPGDQPSPEGTPESAESASDSGAEGAGPQDTGPETPTGGAGPV